MSRPAILPEPGDTGTAPTTVVLRDVLGLAQGVPLPPVTLRFLRCSNSLFEVEVDGGPRTVRISLSAWQTWAKWEGIKWTHIPVPPPMKTLTGEQQGLFLARSS